MSKYTVRFIIILGLCLNCGHTSLYSSNQQYNSGLVEQTSSLLPLVGKKCTVFLNNSEKVNGTLWDIGEDFITLKVKKGLLYSKAEKYGLSEINYIEDSKGTKIEIASLKTKNNVNTFSEDEESSKLYFHTGDLIKEENEQTQEPEKVETPVNRLDELNSLSRLNRIDSPIETKKVETETRPVETNLVSKAQDNKEKFPEKVVEEKSKPEPETTATLVTKNNKMSEQETYFQSDFETSEDNQVEESVAQTEPPNTLVQSQTRDEFSENIPPVAATQKLKILRYQTTILYSVGVFVIALIIFLKVTGLKGTAFGKFSLFPSHLMKISGSYGIIDQGSGDKVKVDDVIRLYRKFSHKIEFKGKVKVIKVADNYSAVEMIKNNEYAPLEVGDVGFRDRNSLTTAIKKMRILFSALFSSLGRTFSNAAQNLEVRQKEPQINFGIFHKDVKPKNSKHNTALNTTAPPQQSNLEKPAKSTIANVKVEKAPGKPVVAQAKAKKESSKSVVTEAKTKTNPSKPVAKVVTAAKETRKPAVTIVKPKKVIPKPNLSKINSSEEIQLIGFGLSDD